MKEDIAKAVVDDGPGYLEAVNTIGGPLAVGLLLGIIIGVVITGAISYWALHLTSSNVNESRKLDLEREKELRIQLGKKDERIDKLHDKREDYLKKIEDRINKQKEG